MDDKLEVFGGVILTIIGVILTIIVVAIAVLLASLPFAFLGWIIISVANIVGAALVLTYFSAMIVGLGLSVLIAGIAAIKN
jgi:hypothetical protein